MRGWKDRWRWSTDRRWGGGKQFGSFQTAQRRVSEGQIGMCVQVYPCGKLNCVCVGACVCTVCEWVDTVCAIRFVVHRSLEKSSRNTKVEKIILEHLKQNCVCLCVCVFFKYNHTYFDFRLVSAWHDLQWRGKQSLPVTWCHLWIKHAKAEQEFSIGRMISSF